MQVDEILKLSAIFIGEEEVSNMNLLNSITTYMPMDEDVLYADDEALVKKSDMLLKCLNLVIEDIARDYLALLHEENIVFNDKKFEYANLSKVICDIIKLQAPNGLSIKFKTFPTHIKADIKKAVITYSYLPEELTYHQAFDFFDNKLTPRIIAYGVAMEYLFLNSLSDEAAIWENRFLTSLQNALRKKHNVTLPRRGWF